MPLSQSDPALDYGGSWGDASEGWPSISFPTEEEARRAYVTAWRDVKVPYGSYVLVGTALRLETEEYRKLVELYLSKKKEEVMPDEKESGAAAANAAEPADTKAAPTLPRDRLSEGILKMLRAAGYPHVLLAFADEAGAYWVGHTGTLSIYRLHRLAGVVIDEIQARLDRTPVAPAAVPTEGPKP